MPDGQSRGAPRIIYPTMLVGPNEPPAPSQPGALWYDTSASALKPFDPVTSRWQPQNPTGMITPYAAAIAPSGWLLCDGAAVSRRLYAALFAIIGTTFGSGDGSTTFNVPDLRGRVVFGFKATDSAFDVLGETGGAQTHTHAGHSDHAALTNNHSGGSVNNEAGHTHSGSGSTGAEASHAHNVSGGTGGPSTVSVADFGGMWNPANSDHTHSFNVSSGAGTSHSHGASNVGAGSSHGHGFNNPSAHGAISAHSAHDTPSHLPPYMALQFIIKT